MPRTREGSVVVRKDNSIWARVTYIDNGKRKEKWRRANTRTHTKNLIKDLIRELDDHGPEFVDAAKMTFSELADYYEKTYLVEPQYRDGKKIAGLRSFEKFKPLLDVARYYFKDRRIRSITFADIKNFKAVRLKTPTKHKRERSIATVNRELSLLRVVLNVAVQNKWIIRNPFSEGKLISPGDEKPRERILSREEEEKLLAECKGPRAHIKAIIIAGLDTGCRRAELLKLEWKDVDFEGKRLLIQAMNTKTLKQREVPMSNRLMKELMNLYEYSTGDPASSVFGITDSFKKSFNTAKRKAGISDLKFHDLRHSFASRLVTMNVPIAEVSRILGHSTILMSYRYTNIDSKGVSRIGSIINSFNEESFSRSLGEKGESFIN
jgi:integrase